ncbi:MAG: hypothetical protein RIQ60_2312 [Pseudomonadota bacterium]
MQSDTLRLRVASSPTRSAARCALTALHPGPRLSALAVAAMLGAMAAHAAPPTSGAYLLDQTQSHVEDATSKGLKLPNTVLCYMNATGANQTAVVNVGDYLALIDETRCENSSAAAAMSSTSSVAAGAPRYARAFINSHRSDNSSPLNARMWIMQDEMRSASGSVITGVIHARLAASEAASDVSPYGRFHVDFCGLPDGTTDCLNAMYGYAEGDGASVKAFQRGDQNISMTLTGSTTSGSGRVVFAESAGAPVTDWQFAYDAAYFRRDLSAGGSDQCFDRAFANADKTAWSYGVYGADGARLERNSGFPIKSGNNYGYVGYWGLWMQGKATLDDGASVTRYAYSNQQAASGTYTLVRKDGRLKKLTRHQTTLDGIRNVPFSFWVNQSFNDTGNTLRNAGTVLELRWNGGDFIITAQGGSGGGSPTPDAAGNALPAQVLQSSWNLNGWSQSLGGSITLLTRDSNGVYLPPTASSVVTYRSETVVAPGSVDWPSGSLHCLSDCPRGGANFISGLNNTSNTGLTPYLNLVLDTGAQPITSRWNWQPVLKGNELNYTLGASGQANDGVLLNANLAPVVWAGTSAPANSEYQNGFQSGRLVDDTALASLQCAAGGGPGATHYCQDRIDSIDTYYVWETGPNSWNRFSGLMAAGGAMVQFDAPLALQYAVPADAPHAYAGAQMVLQYNGFGDLQGVPGKCVDPLTNADVPCSSNNGSTRWVSAFVIPEGSAVSDGNSTYWVKPLQQELRLKKVSASLCAGLTLPTILDGDMPGGGGFSDPSGLAVPVVTEAPRVIHGAVQY